MPRLGLGTWEMGGRMEPDLSKDKKYIKAIDTALQTGYKHIDTAEMYGQGHTEEIVARGIQNHNRENLFITSKVRKAHLKYFDVMEAASRSLERLQTHYLDLYLIHEPNRAIPIKETMKAMDELIQKGWVKSIGVSNFNLNALQEAEAAAKNPVVVNQIEYNLTTRNQGMYTQNMETEIIPYCQQNQIIITAWRPLLKGKLPQTTGLNEIAEVHQATPYQIALAWLLNKPGMTTIAKATSEKNLRANYEAQKIILSEKEIDSLNRFQMV
jgi:diketogulonate reductase-like aldo/keto reductase